MITPRTLLVMSTAALVTGGLFAYGPEAQVVGPPEGSTTTAPSDTTTSTGLLPPFEGATTTTTVASLPPQDGPPPPTAPPVGGDDPGTDGAPRIVPSEYLPLINSVRRTRGRDTSRLVSALEALVESGASPEEVMAVGFGRFPVAGYATYSDDWWLPRFTPVFHLHEGTDIFAAAGTPVRSPVDGTLRQVGGPVGGTTAYVTESDGSYYYFAHLSGYPEGQASGQKVATGDVIGYVGASGNARGGAPHAHFEVHPRLSRNGVRTTRASSAAFAAVPPKPDLDRWLDEALAAVQQLVGRLDAERPRAVTAIAATRAFGHRDVGGSPVGPPHAQLAWASAASPAGGALAVAQDAAASAARDMDWSRAASAHARRVREWQEADRVAWELLSLVTPEPLLALLGPRPSDRR